MSSLLRERAEELVDDPSDVEWTETIAASYRELIEEAAGVDPLAIDCPYPSCGAEAGRMCWGNERPQFAHNSRRSNAIRCHFGLEEKG